jgi:hypothetical protein
MNYLLKDDYDEVGFMQYSQKDGSGHVFNYIKQDCKYYVIDLTHYRNDFLNTAVEEGDILAYYGSDFISGNIHEVDNLMDYARYCVENFNEPPALFTAYTSINALPIDAVKVDSMVYITYPELYQEKILKVYDPVNDNVRLNFEPGPSKYPKKWEPFNTKL